jgi:hypothetical protein
VFSVSFHIFISISFHQILLLQCFWASDLFRSHLLGQQAHAEIGNVCLFDVWQDSELYGLIRNVCMVMLLHFDIMDSVVAAT